eukprot:6248214-Amphidinium_carterae.1
MHALTGSYCVFADIALQRLEMSAVTKTEEWIKHHRKGHLNKIPDCPGCQLESGPRIIHSKTPKSDRKAGVLHGDLAKMGNDNRQFTWILVLAASVRMRTASFRSTFPCFARIANLWPGRWLKPSSGFEARLTALQ